MKPREWKIFGIACAEKGSAAYDNFQWNEGAVHAIEKPAYDRLEAMCEDVLCDLVYAESYCGHPGTKEYLSKRIAEYRAMRDETKMPCPRNE